MSGELEAAGAMATAGLAGAAIEGRAPGDAGEGVCLNCDAPLSGRYCANCGQSAHPHRTLAHVFEEFVHGVLHFDTKAWRTLPMVMFRPGTLTYNYIHGKRARYISPLALFLFTIFAMFFTFSFTRVDVNVDTPSTRELAVLEGQLETARTRLVTAERAAAAAGTSASAAAAVEAARREVSALESAVTRTDARAQRDIEAVRSGEGAETAQSWQQIVANAAARRDFVLIAGMDDLNERANKKLENPEYALYKVQQTAYKFSFLLAPLSLPFIALLFFWKRGVTLYGHMVYALYALSFAAILLIIAVIASQAPWSGWIGEWAIALGLPAHTFFQLKGGYRLGWFSALWRAVLMLTFALIILMLFLASIFIIGLGGG